MPRHLTAIKVYVPDSGASIPFFRMIHAGSLAEREGDSCVLKSGSRLRFLIDFLEKAEAKAYVKTTAAGIRSPGGIQRAQAGVTC